MTSRLYIQKRGPSGGAHLDQTAFTGRKGTPFFDGQASLIELGHRYEQGQATQGTFVLMDPEAEMPAADFEYEISPHVLVTWTEDAPGSEIWLARTRIVGYDGGRDVVKIDNEVRFDVTVEDCNVELRGQAFSEAWVRPEETDIQRLVALQLYTLNGASSTADHFRETCTVIVNTSHLAPNTNTVTMPAKKYLPGTQPQEVVEDCAQMAGKMYGVVIHHTGGSHLCLLYVTNADNLTYASPCKISDNLADWDPLDPTAPVFEPHWETSAATTTDFQTTLSGFVSIWGDGEQAAFVEYPTNIESYDYWVEEYHDSASTSAAQSANRAAGILEERRQPILTHHPSVIVQPSQVHLLAAGMGIQVKFAASMGGIYLDTWQTRRIVECRWEPRHDGTYWAHLQLERAVLRVAPGRGRVGPLPPVQSEPGGTSLFLWTFEVNNKDTTDTYPVGTLATNWHAGMVHSHVLHPSVGNFAGASPQPPITPGTYHIRAIIRRATSSYNPSGITFTAWSFDGSSPTALWTSDPVTSLIATTVESDIVVPAGADTLAFQLNNNASELLEVEVTDGGDSFVGTPPPSGPTPGGSVGESPYYSPLDHQHSPQTAEETPISDAGSYFQGGNVEEALQELGAGTLSGFVKAAFGGEETLNTVAASGSTETLDLADGNVHDVTLTADCTFTFTGATTGLGVSFMLILRQDGTGGRTATWPGSVEWPDGTPPVLATEANAVDILSFYTVDGGTTWFGFQAGGGTAEGTGIGEILISDTPSTPLVFADLIQNEAQDDLVYGDP